MTKKVLCLDIDRSLIVKKSVVQDDDDEFKPRFKGHLKAINMLDQNKYNRFLAIYPGPMAKIIAEALANGVEICFITRGDHQREDFIPFIELLYDLKPNSLKDCLFIKGDPNGVREPIGATLLTAKRKKYFADDAMLTVVDDDYEFNEVSVLKAGFKYIRATGWPGATKLMELPPICSVYLVQICISFEFALLFSIAEMQMLSDEATSSPDKPPLAEEAEHKTIGTKRTDNRAHMGCRKKLEY